MTPVSLTQQQYHQFIDSISGLEARVASLLTHAEAPQQQIRVAEILIQQLRTTGANPPSPTRTFLPRQVTEGGAKVHWKPFRAPRLVFQCETSPHTSGRRDLLDCCSGYRDRSMKSTRTMCLGTEERRTSASRTWIGSTRSGTRHWLSRHPIRRWRPSSHWRNWKSRESLAGNA